MFFETDDGLRKKAKTPHELSMLNLMFFHLLLGAGMVVLLLTRADIIQSVGNAGFFLPLVASLSVITFIHLRAHRAREHEPWFVAAHWQLAMKRSRLLLIAYAITGLIIGGGVLIASGIDKKSMQDIVMTIATRIGAVPTLLMVMVSFVLESGAIYQAGRGEVPDALLKKFPAPVDAAGRICSKRPGANMS
jgi:hypothetical protein